MGVVLEIEEKDVDTIITLFDRHYKTIEETGKDFEGLPASLQNAYSIYELARELERA